MVEGGWGGVTRGFFTVSVEIFPKILSLHPPYFQNFWSSSFVDGLKLFVKRLVRAINFLSLITLETTSLPVNIEVAKLQSLSDRVMEVEITSHGVWKSLSLLFQCTGAGLIVTLFVSLSGGTTSGFGAKIPDLLRI